MAQPPAIPDLTNSDYEAIESAVMETARGRWFLSQYAQRNRSADTGVLLAALARLEQSISDQRSSIGVDRFKVDLVDMSTHIAETRRQISELHGQESEGSNNLDQVSTTLDAVVLSTEKATTDILSAAEAIQDKTWMLREQGADPDLCDAIEEQSTNIYLACSFQDLTAQRTRKVIDVLRYLETRINAMIDIWGFDENAAPPPPRTAGPVSATPLIDDGDDANLSQSDIDFVLVDERLDETSGTMPQLLRETAEAEISSPAEEFDDIILQDAPAVGSAYEFEDVAASQPGEVHTLRPIGVQAQPRGTQIEDIDRLSAPEKMQLFV